jgi:Domain of unknown function (DUF4304)
LKINQLTHFNLEILRGVKSLLLMQNNIDHNKLIKKIAKERLKPHGIFQQGKSRTFLYDNGWYIIVIEFQPSSWSKGTFLNIGVDFNFYPRDYLAFSYGYREKDFVELKTQQHFESVIHQMCDLILLKVNELNYKFRDIGSSINTLDKDTLKDTWRLFNLSILKVISNDFEGSKKLLEMVCLDKCDRDWEFERKKVATEILSWMSDDTILFDKLKELINTTRGLKKLPLIPIELDKI